MRAQVLLACIKCPGSHLLTNQNLIDIFQACFRIGHYQGDSNSSKGMQGAPLPMQACNVRTCKAQTATKIHTIAAE